MCCFLIAKAFGFCSLVVVEKECFVTLYIYMNIIKLLKSFHCVRIISPYTSGSGCFENPLG